MTFKSELQAINVQLEDATLMELEELLYDRLHLVWTDGQVLLCHSGNFFPPWKQITFNASNNLVMYLKNNFLQVTIGASLENGKTRKVI